MKLEIDLDDILGDEDGVETLRESVRRQVVENVTKIIKKGVDAKIDQAVSAILGKELEVVLKDRMPEIVQDVLTRPYTPVSVYGNRSEPTTFRDQLVNAIHSQMVYKNGSYSSDRNAFTDAVNAIIKAQVDTFQAAFKKEVDAKYTREVMAIAEGSLKAKLGIK